MAFLCPAKYDPCAKKNLSSAFNGPQEYFTVEAPDGEQGCSAFPFVIVEPPFRRVNAVAIRLPRCLLKKTLNVFVVTLEGPCGSVFAPGPQNVVLPRDGEAGLQPL